MLSEIELRVDTKQAKKALRLLRDKESLLVARATNRSIGTAKKTISREIRMRYVKVRDEHVRKALFHTSRATESQPMAVLKYSSKHENLFKMGVVKPEHIVQSLGPGKHDPDVYTAYVMHGESPKPLDSPTKSFVQRIKNPGGNDKIGLFQRTTSDPLPIRGVYAPTLTQMMKNEEVMQEVKRATMEMMQKRLEHEIDYELRKNK